MVTPEHSLVQDVSTRRNSTFYMVSQLIEQRWPVTATLSYISVTQKGKRYHDLKPEQWKKNIRRTFKSPQGFWMCHCVHVCREIHNNICNTSTCEGAIQVHRECCLRVGAVAGFSTHCSSLPPIQLLHQHLLPLYLIHSLVPAVKKGMDQAEMRMSTPK